MVRVANGRAIPSSGNNSEMRLLLRKAIETVRVAGSHGLHPQLLVQLARQFQLRAAEVTDEQLKNALEQRADLYWNAATPLLERMENNQVIRDVSAKLFNFHADDFKLDAIHKAQEEGKLFLALQMMKKENYLDAIESLNNLTSPYATYYQAMMFKKLFDGTEGADKTVLLLRAKESLQLTENRLNRPGISNHPLFPLFYELSDEIDSLLTKSITDNHSNADNATQRSPSKLASNSLTALATERWLLNEASPRTPHNAPQRSPQSARSTRTELFPPTTPTSTEVDKLTSQIGELMASKADMSKEVTLLRTDLGDVKTILGDLLSEFKKLSVKLAERPSTSDDLFGFVDADDYVVDTGYGTASAAASNIQQQQQVNNSNRGMIQPAPMPFNPTAFGPLSRGPVDVMPFYPGLMWNGGLPFTEGQQLPDFRGTTAPMIMPPTAAVPPIQPVQPALPFVPNFTVPKHVPNVVVTSSETLPAVTITSTPIMSVTIPAEHVRQTPKPAVKDAHAFQIALPPGTNVVSPSILQSPSDQHEARMYSQKTVQFNTTTPADSPNKIIDTPKPILKPAATNSPGTFQFGKQNSPSILKSSLLESPKQNTSFNSSNDGSVNEPDYDPRPDFKPIVSLAEVEVHTGEEGETKLFESHAKLYVFRTNEWKERGQGDVKILHDEETDKVRVLMRRDQVHKICANHHIMAEMSLSPMKNAANAFVWAASDFADGEVVVEKFCIKFKTLDEAKDFEYAFNQGRQIAKDTVKKPSPANSAVTSTTPNVDPPTTTPIVDPSTKNTFGFSKPISFTTPNSVTKPVTSGTPTGDALMDESKPVFGSGNVLDFTSLAKGVASTNAFKPSAEFKGFAGAGTTVFGSKPATPVASNDKKNNETGPNATLDDSFEEFEPNVDFTPVIPLPELVVVKTGEEGQTVLFEERAKILRFASETKEWKEKGVGAVKILLHPETGRVRILMRRDQVHKVCCNHHIDSSIKFTRMTASPKAATWTAQDFSEGEPRSEILCIRFGRVEMLEAFLATIDSVQKTMKDGKMEVDADKSAKAKKPAELLPLSEQFKKAGNTWECPTCLVSNNDNLNKCPCCDSNRPASKVADVPKPLSEMFKKAPGSWECPGCMVRNEGDVVKCKCCETVKPGCKDAPTTEKSSGFSFGAKSATGTFSFGVPSPSTGFTFGIPPATVISSPAAYSYGSLAGVNTTAASSGFNFASKPGSNTTTTSSPGFTFGAMTSSVDKPTGRISSPAVVSATAPAPSPAFGFGNATPTKPVNGLVFGSDTKLGSSEKFNFTLKASEGSPSVAMTKSPAADKSDGEADDLEREDENIKFEPIIPLPDKVVVQTGEENEDLVYCHRAKLYRFVDSEWKERGLGDFKILRHKETGKVRFLMRREMVLKICLNHYLAKDMELLPKDERSWLWSAPDFSDGVVVQEKFCLKFRDSEIANAFKQAVVNEQNTLEDSPQQTSADSTVADRGSGTAIRALFSEEEPKVVFEYKATSEELAEARLLQLPDNWCKYRYAPPCSGCVGCDKDDASDDNATLVKNENRKFEVTLVEGSENTPKGASESNESSAHSSIKKGNTKADSKADVKLGQPSESKTPVSAESQQKTEPVPVIKFGQLPKPSETIFGAANVSKPVVVPKEPAPETPKPSLFSNFSFKVAMESPKSDGTTSIFGSASGNIFGSKKIDFSKPPVFGSIPSATGSATSTPTIFGSSLFGSQNSKDSSPSIFGNTSGNIFGGSTSLETKQPAFNAPDSCSFASLAAKSGSAFQTKPAPEWSPGVKPIFSNSQNTKKNEDGNSDDGHAEEETDHDPHYDPVIDLPDLIEVKTGEEDEDKLFGEHAKLYRFDSKLSEWKMRGTGEMKVLHNPQQGSYRLLMRREQVHKPVCNMRITVSTELKPMQKPNSWIWTGMNYAEEEGQEQLAVVYKTNVQAENFKTVVDKCVCSIKDKSNVSASEHDYFSTGANTTRDTEDVSDGYDEEDYEGGDCEENDDDEYEESLVLSKEGVTLTTGELVASHLKLEVFEHNSGGPYRIMVHDTVPQSHSMIDPNDTHFAYKLPPVGLIWKAQDWAQDEDESVSRTIRIDLPTAEDAQHVYDTVNAQDLTDEVKETFDMPPC